MEKVTISESVTSIGNYAFSDCKDLEEVLFEEGSKLVTIGESAFRECRSLESIEIPNSVTYIGDYAFCYCTSLESITIPNGVTAIGSCAFASCSSLTNIEIPNNVTSLERYAFYNCPSLEEVYYDGTIEDWCNIQFKNSSSNPMDCAKHFYMKDSNNEYYEVTELVIPDTVSRIGDFNFYGFDNLTKIELSDSVKEIGTSAFAYCKSLKSFTLYFFNTIWDFDAF